MPTALAEQLRPNPTRDVVAARAQGFALASSANRSFGVQVVGSEPEFEPKVSTIPHLIKSGRWLTAAVQEAVLGSAAGTQSPHPGWR